jgi:UDP-2,3-diacylglucosamine hydrolase
VGVRASPIAIRDVPAMTAPVVVAGDVHLSPERRDVAKRFDRFLDGRAGLGGTLVLLGDVFDWWAGPGQAREPVAASVIARLGALSSAGTRVVFLGGNRDYALDARAVPGLEVLPDPARTRWGERTVVLTHGDLLCSGDLRYQRMRRVLRSAPARGLLRALPHASAAYFARGLRDLSEREVRRKPYASMGIDYGIAREWLEAFDADLLVAGHVHTGVHHRLSGDGRPRDVIVVKDWERGGGVVRWDGTRVDLVPPENA